MGHMDLPLPPLGPSRWQLWLRWVGYIEHVVSESQEIRRVFPGTLETSSHQLQGYRQDESYSDSKWPSLLKDLSCGVQFRPNMGI